MQEALARKEQPRFESSDPFVFLEELRDRAKEAPLLKKAIPFSLEEIADREEVEPGRLEKRIQQTVKELAEKLKRANSCDEKNLPTIDTLYNLFLLSGDERIVSESQWLKNFRFFDRFVRHFCPRALPNSQAYIGMHIDMFMNSELYIQPKANQTRMIYFGPRDVHYMRDVERKNEFSIYSADGEWVLMPEEGKYWNDLYRFVEKSVIREVTELISDGYAKPDLTHSSGSAALPGIAKHGALLSAAEAKARGETIQTGEFFSYILRPGLESYEEQRASGGVYSDKSGMPHFLRGYNVARWFDEFYMTFGINREKQDKFLRAKGGEIEDFGSEGMVIGNEVPLRNVDFVYYQKLHEDMVRRWTNENAPQARIISLEADEIIHKYHNQINRIAIREQTEPVKIWGALLNY